jgi:hypothetical protein
MRAIHTRSFRAILELVPELRELMSKKSKREAFNTVIAEVRRCIYAPY